MLKLHDVLKLAKARHPVAALRSVVFDGQSAICASEVAWMVGVPCPQPSLTAPVVVPIDAVLSHLAKSRHLVVTAEHLSNGQGLITPFNKDPGVDYDSVLDMLPRPPEGEAISFDLELNALDRVVVAAAQEDVRYYLKGVMFDLTDGVMVGTNGHRVHVYRNRVPQAFDRAVMDGVPTAASVQCILPREPLHWVLGSLADTAKLTIWNPRGGADVKTCALLQAEDGFVWIREAIQGRFPDWSRVVPAMHTRPVWGELDPMKLSDAAAAVSKVVALSGDASGAVRLDFGGAAVRGFRPEDALPMPVQLHSNSSSVDPASLSDALHLEICAQYLQDVADCVTGEAQWRVSHLNPENEVLMVVDGDFTGLVMPCRPKLKEEPAPAAEAPAVAVPVGVAVADEEDAEPEQEPCPAAVAAMAAQLVGQLQEAAKKAAVKPLMARKARQPVAA